MILYVNGTDFSAGAKAANEFSFANDDFKYVALGSKPHPQNLSVSYGMHLSKMLKLALVCEAESQSTNERILNTTYNYINNISPKQFTIVVIGWGSLTLKTIKMHEEIYELHTILTKKKISHLFFNEVANMSVVPKDLHKNWKHNFIGPYDQIANEFDHLSWAQLLFKHLTTQNISV
jgi:hypothetical protein